MSRAYTEEEIRKMVMDHVRSLIDYWAGGRCSNVPTHYTARERLEGLMHSTLVMIDGGSMDLPGFQLIPHPHPDDKKYHEDEGSNYFPDDVDIAGCLHEMLWDHDFDGKKF